MKNSVEECVRHAVKSILFLRFESSVVDYTRYYKLIKKEQAFLSKEEVAFLKKEKPKIDFYDGLKTKNGLLSNLQGFFVGGDDENSNDEEDEDFDEDDDYDDEDFDDEDFDEDDDKKSKKNNKSKASEISQKYSFFLGGLIDKGLVAEPFSFKIGKKYVDHEVYVDNPEFKKGFFGKIICKFKKIPEKIPTMKNELLDCVVMTNVSKEMENIKKVFKDEFKKAGFNLNSFQISFKYKYRRSNDAVEEAIRMSSGGDSGNKTIFDFTKADKEGEYVAATEDTLYDVTDENIGTIEDIKKHLDKIANDLNKFKLTINVISPVKVNKSETLGYHKALEKECKLILEYFNKYYPEVGLK